MQRAKLRYLLNKYLNHSIQIGSINPCSKTEPNRAVRLLWPTSHGQQDMTRLETARSASRPRRRTDSLHIERQKRSLSLEISELQVRHGWQSVLSFAVHSNALNAIKHLLFESVTQSLTSSRLGIQVVLRQLGSATQPKNTRCILGTRSQTTLLIPARLDSF